MLNIPLDVEDDLLGIAREGGAGQLLSGLVGLEKECLRVAKHGGIAMTPHPTGLGSALTHPWITTDYSEALLELVTPALADHQQVMVFLNDLHLYVQRHLGDELMWATSMPCVLHGEHNIPIAEYGTSNAGRMKHLYRVGLGNRYGRVMQVIAGVHYNLSFGDEFWQVLHRAQGSPLELRGFQDQNYMGLIRNLLRYSWLIPYLFGASPAICKSFFQDGHAPLAEFDEATYYEPYATSLRLGEFGYQNKREEGVGVKANYDTVQSYVASLVRASTTPALLWEEIGVKVNGEYQQLNANILQIENEYYSSVRPKQPPKCMEPPGIALWNRGIAYVELRSLDLNPYHPLGVDEVQLRFIRAFMLYCLLLDSPMICFRERREIDRNMLHVAHMGREPGLKLLREGMDVRLDVAATELLHAMEPLMEMLDAQSGGDEFQECLGDQLEKVKHPELTPSGRMLDEMRDRGESFYEFARRMSATHARWFSEQSLSSVRMAELDALAAQSLKQQADMEQDLSTDLDTFMDQYFSQLHALAKQLPGSTT